ncbi:MAG TPA: ABC transporter ATP-binding protein [Chloroflexota bacterium]|nr:ABC transporter ATP-binding protein [Chloroflexota bacterium]
MLVVEDIATKYGQIAALKGISFRVETGEIVALIGANGAGKSTTLRTLSGVLHPWKGKVIFEGKEIQGRRPWDITRMGIGQCPEGRQIFTRMTVEENLRIGHYTQRHNTKFEEEADRVTARFPRLKERWKQVGQTLSGGEQQMLAIARVMMSRPRLLLLDEPSLGLAPIIVERIFETIDEINARGTTILLVEQNAQLALAMADRAYVLETGRIVLEGTGEELLENPAVRKAYLGIS